MPPRNVGLIGAGALATFLAEGLIAAGEPASRIWVSNRHGGAHLQRFSAMGAHVTREKSELCARADVLVLLVKPQDAPGMLDEMAPHVRPRHRLLSCMAGVPTRFVESRLGGRPRVVRAMPNIACAVRGSATAVCGGSHLGAGDLEAATELLSAVGTVTVVGEEWMDAVTAVSGSGPAYVFLLMEAMREAAAALGMDRGTAYRLIVQTVLGAAQVAAASERDPEELRASVTSRGGTTMAALEVLEASGARPALVAAVRRAAARSRELGAAWQTEGGAVPESGGKAAGEAAG